MDGPYEFRSYMIETLALNFFLALHCFLPFFYCYFFTQMECQGSGLPNDTKINAGLYSKCRSKSMSQLFRARTTWRFNSTCDVSKSSRCFSYLCVSLRTEEISPAWTRTKLFRSLWTGEVMGSPQMISWITWRKNILTMMCLLLTTRTKILFLITALSMKVMVMTRRKLFR